jgi:hypothetical protein
MFPPREGSRPAVPKQPAEPGNLSPHITPRFKKFLRTKFSTELPLTKAFSTRLLSIDGARRCDAVHKIFNSRWFHERLSSLARESRRNFRDKNNRSVGVPDLADLGD